MGVVVTVTTTGSFWEPYKSNRPRAPKRSPGGTPLAQCQPFHSRKRTTSVHRQRVCPESGMFSLNVQIERFLKDQGWYIPPQRKLRHVSYSQRDPDCGQQHSGPPWARAQPGWPGVQWAPSLTSSPELPFCVCSSVNWVPQKQHLLHGIVLRIRCQPAHGKQWSQYLWI